MHRALAAAFSLILVPSLAMAAGDFAPYGSSEPVNLKYQPAKLAYEWSSSPEDAKANLQQLIDVLKAAQRLQPPGSKIEVVVIGGGIGVFAKENYETFQAQMDEINDLHGAKAKIPVDVAYCGTSLRGAGYAVSDMHGFGKVVPAGYLELDRLAKEGYSHSMIMDYKTRGARYYFQPELRPASK
jgi:intracellular sulfur oxidation DsrE/DsrF family protein